MIDVCIPCFSPVYSYGLTPDLYVDRRSRQATEGINYRNLRFPFQNAGARAAGITHGAVHFAAAAESSGADQADFFMNTGGTGPRMDRRCLGCWRWRAILRGSCAMG